MSRPKNVQFLALYSSFNFSANLDLVRLVLKLKFAQSAYISLLIYCIT